MRIYFILLFYILFFACYAKGQGSPNNNNRLILGEIKQILQSEAPQDTFTADYDLKFLGSVKTEKTNFNLYLFLKEFGNKRLTKRLIVFSKDFDYLGMYDIPEFPQMVKGDRVIFPLDEKWGNSIVFEGASPPREIYLDGETYSFFRDDEQ